MGNDKRTKKTLSEVKQDLQNDLLHNAQQRLSTDYHVQSKAGLEDVLLQLAKYRFKDKFKYDYDDSPTTIKPPDSIATNYPLKHLCSIDDPGSGQVGEYVDQLLDAVDLPTWMRSCAWADLTTLASTLISQDTYRQWNYDEYIHSYDADAETQNSWKCDVVLVFVNGSLLEDGLTANLCIIYFLGVYYNIKTEAKETRDGLQHNAYQTAQSTTGVPNIKGNQTLGDALYKYGQSTFKNNFKFDWNATDRKHGPPDYPDDGRAFNVSTTHQLCYLQDLDSTHTIPNFVKDTIFGGIDVFKDPSVKARAIADVTQQFETILNNRSSGSWITHYIDSTYNVTNPSYDPVRTRGVVFYFYDHHGTQENVEISVTYIFYMAMFYEIFPPAHNLKRDLWIDLCNDLIQNMPHKSSNGKDLDALRADADKYARIQFAEAFGFDYDADPPDAKSSRKGTIRKHAWFSPAKYPADSTEIAGLITTELFPRDYDHGTNNPFPVYAASAIFDNILGLMTYSLSNETLSVVNWWDSKHQDDFFDDPKKFKDSIHQYAVCLSVLGSKSEGGSTFTQSYCSLLAAWCACDNSWSET